MSYGTTIPVNEMLDIAKCESNYKWYAKNEYSSASGLWQFTKDTWLEGVKKRGLNWTLEDRFNPIKSTNMMIWYVEKEGWDRWECKKVLNK